MQNPPIAYHLTVRTQPWSRPFVQDRACQVLWSCLKRQFPDCLAAVVMPNHFHLVVSTSEKPWILKQRVGIVLRAVSRTLGPKVVQWQLGSKPEPLVDRTKTVITMRYVHLNPVRASLTRDPLAWRWSTLWEYLLPAENQTWSHRGTAALLHQVHLRSLSKEIMHFTLNDPLCSLDSRKPLLAGNSELKPASFRIVRALSILHHEPITRKHSPILIRAHLTFGQLELGATAKVLGFSARGVQKAIKRLDPKVWETARAGLALFLANPRLASEPQSSHSNEQNTPEGNFRDRKFAESRTSGR